MGDSGHPCFTLIVLATASDKPLEDRTFPDMDHRERKELQILEREESRKRENVQER